MAEQKTVTDHVAGWLAGQSFNNVMLCLILCAIGWGGWYALTTAIPQHLRAIQSGYETIDQRHREERTRITDTYDKWIGSNKVAEGKR